MICEGYKTRFTKPFQKVEIEVPYESGMDPYSGLLEVAKAVGVVIQHGSWYTIKGSEDKMRADDIFLNHADEVLALLEAETSAFLEADAEVDTNAGESAKSKRMQKHAGMQEQAAE